jgi:hypothetical protein
LQAAALMACGIGECVAKEKDRGRGGWRWGRGGLVELGRNARVFVCANGK